MAIFLVISMMSMILLGSLGAVAAAFGYDDQVSRREYRLQAGLNAQSCVAVALLSFAHDYFYSAANQVVSDFSCTIVSAVRNGFVMSIRVIGYDNGVSEWLSTTSS